MLQVLEYFQGKRLESAFVQKDDDINELAKYIDEKIQNIDIQYNNFQNHDQTFIIIYGDLYLEVLKEIELKFKQKCSSNYLRYKQNIQVMIAKRFRKIAKIHQNQIYSKIIKPFKQQCILPQVNSINKNFRQLQEEYYLNYIQLVQHINEDKPQTMDWILIKYEQKIKNMISNSLIKHQLKTKNHIKYSNLIQEYIYCYLSAQQYWILTKDHIIQLVQFGNKLKKQILQDVELGIERFMIEISEQFNFNQNDIDQIVQLKQNQFFFENFSADQTVQLIIEIFILLSGFKFQNHSLVIEKYEPSSHAFLLKFCEQINNGKWDFTSSQIINLADKVMGNVYFQIVQQINKGSKNYVKIEFKNDIIQIKMKNQLSNQNFQQTNQAYYYSMNYSFIGAQIQIENCLNKYYSQFIDKIVESKPKDLQKYNKPVVFYLQSPSENKVKSNVITIFVNGFLTQKDAQDKKLSPFYQDTNLETLILVWKASSVANLLSSSLKDAIINACFIDKIITPLITIIANLIMLFKNCFEEAKNVGKYLAYFLHQNYLGNKTINLIGFSLGTVIVYYCLKQLIKLQKESTQEKSLIVHNVLMMGGVADKNLLQKLDFRCISGTFHNVFSRNDQVLTKVLTIFDKKIYPCGLDPILSIHPNVKNHNFTNKVDGHFCYKEKILKEILELTNFDDQYLIF